MQTLSAQPKQCFAAAVPKTGAAAVVAWRYAKARRLAWATLLAVASSLAVAGSVDAAVYAGSPASYQKLVRHLKPGDTLLLAAGRYRHDLVLHDIQGAKGRPIVIRGAPGRAHTVFVAQSGHNTVSIANAAYIELHDLVLDGRGLTVDAVKAEGPSRWAHHITLDGLVIFGYDADQQNVGISTKSPAWAWTVRNCIIDSAGTGMYFGMPDGSTPFFDGLIEHNVILDTPGYNIEIKHQNRWPKLPLDGPRAGTTIIRYNVFSKAHHGSHGRLARPNLLTDHWPEKGEGKDDLYQIYGNFFYENPTERLFQGEGNIALYDNLFVNDVGDAVSIQRHHGPAKRIEIFDNTVVAKGAGILVHGTDPHYRQRVFANAVFAAVPLRGAERKDNVTAPYTRAGDYLNNPAGAVMEEAAIYIRGLRNTIDHPGDVYARGKGNASKNGSKPPPVFLSSSNLKPLDLYPRAGRLGLSRPLLDPVAARAGIGRDFNGRPRKGHFAGAYAGDGDNPGWALSLGPIPPRNTRE